MLLLYCCSSSILKCFTDGSQTFLNVRLRQLITLHIIIRLMDATFMRTAAHVFVLVFFGTKYSPVAAWIGAIHVAFAWCSIEPVLSDHDMFDAIDIHTDALIEYIHFPIPKIAFNRFVFAVGCDPAMQLADIFKTFFDEPT